MAFMDDSPATKGDIGELRQEFGGLRRGLHDEIAGFEARMMAAMRNFEANLLKAFYGYAESTRQRFAFIEGQSENVMTRMKVIEERVVEIEKRLNLPPAL
jgi:hypothetical protein